MIEYKQVTFHEALAMLEDDEPLWIEQKDNRTGESGLIPLNMGQPMQLKVWTRQNYFKRTNNEEGNENE